MIEMDEDREMERFHALAKEIVYEYDLEDDTREYIYELIADWATDTDSRNGIVLQVAANQEFGAELSDYTVQRAKALNINLNTDFNTARSVLRYLYERTTRYSITVYRAIDFNGSNALESWTTDREIAEFYVNQNRGGVIVEKETSRYISYTTGFGLECAKEIVVIN